jgi:hypothetical protein
MTVRATKRLGITLSAALLVGCRCDGLGAAKPALGIDVRLERAHYELQFENCAGPSPIEVYYIKVLPAVALEVADATPPICQLEFDYRGSNSRPLTERWTYGSVPPGYRQTGACEALERGREYRVLTANQGSARFKIREDGSVKLLDGGCPADP